MPDDPGRLSGLARQRPVVHRLRADDRRLTTDDHDRLPSLARQQPVVHRPWSIVSTGRPMTRAYRPLSVKKIREEK